MRTGVEVRYFLLQLKSGCRGRKLGGARVKILLGPFRRTLRRSMRVPILVLGNTQQPLQSGVSLGGISLLANGVVETGRRREPRRDHPGLARMGRWHSAILACRRKLRRSGTWPLWHGHQLSGWRWTFRHTITLRSFQFFVPARADANVNVLARRGHCHQPRQHHPLRPTRLICRRRSGPLAFTFKYGKSGI